MAKKKKPQGTAAKSATAAQSVSATADDLLLAALERGDDPAKTGRFLMTFKEGAMDAGVKSLQKQSGLRMANARDFKDQTIRLEEAGDAEAVVFPEIGVALVSGEAAAARSMSSEAFIAEDSPVHSVDPEYFMFASQINPSDYMKGVLQSGAGDLRGSGAANPSWRAAVSPTSRRRSLGATWGLNACRVPPSSFSGNGIKVAVLDTGFDLGHPEFAGRSFVTGIVRRPAGAGPSRSRHAHRRHRDRTASAPGSDQRYGIGFRSQIFIGKVLTNSGSGTQAQVLAGMNWAIANRCAVISMSLGAPDSGPAVLHGGRCGGVGRRMSDRRGLRQRQQSSCGDQPGGRSGELTDRHVGGGARQRAQGRLLLQRRQGGHCRARRQRLFVLAEADVAQYNQRHEHGHAACCRMRGAVGPEQRGSPRSGAAGEIDRDGETAAVPRQRRRRWSGPGALAQFIGTYGSGFRRTVITVRLKPDPAYQ